VTDLHTQVMGEEELAQAREASSERPPEAVPGYTLKRLLDKGSFGEVWLALDHNTGVTRAIKFYAHQGGLDLPLLSREVDKLRLLASNRYVVQLYEVGWKADPPYYVMEYLKNGSLEDLLREVSLGVPEAVELFRKVVEGMARAHDKGILHCDLKPANILLDEDLNPRLADFGQARLSHEKMPALGTLFYMPPEQTRREAVPDVRWDVYALGAILYRMLTGQLPYHTEETARAIQGGADAQERMARYRRCLRKSSPPRAHGKVAGVDKGLRAIIDRCLAMDPNQRFPNVRAILNALDKRAEQSHRRQRWTFGAILPVLLLTVLATIVTSSFEKAVSESREAVIAGVQQGNHFAAQFVAEAVGRQIDQRLLILENEASDDVFRDLLRQARDRPPESRARQALQQHVNRLYARYRQTAESYFWFVDDAQGYELALSPIESDSQTQPTIGRNYAFRDYFHGLGRDLDPAVREKPIRHAHLSRVFRSGATNTLMVAFSVPVWSHDEIKKREPHPLGVLAMSVELGSFQLAARQTASLPGDSQTREWALVDLERNLSLSDVSGLILQHPELKPQTGAFAANLPRLPDPELKRFQELRQHIENGSRISDREWLNDHYTDPVGAEENVRWLATFEPVFVKGRVANGEESIRNPGWGVIVQARYDKAVDPVDTLAVGLLRLKLAAVVVFIGIVLLFWGCMLLLEESYRARLLAFVGLGPRQPALGSGSTPTPLSPAPSDSESSGTRSQPAPNTVVDDLALTPGEAKVAPAERPDFRV
jgi:eukaryotic-like serine/threonine-protein kinase